MVGLVHLLILSRVQQNQGQHNVESLYRTCSNEIHFGIVLEDKARPSKLRSVVDTEEGILLRHQPVSRHLHRELPVLLLEPLQHHGLDVFIQPK